MKITNSKWYNTEVVGVLMSIVFLEGMPLLEMTTRQNSNYKYFCCIKEFQTKAILFSITTPNHFDGTEHLIKEVPKIFERTYSEKDVTFNLIDSIVQ